jgi:hypothetical protein
MFVSDNLKKECNMSRKKIRYTIVFILSALIILVCILVYAIFFRADIEKGNFPHDKLAPMPEVKVILLPVDEETPKIEEVKKTKKVEDLEYLNPPVHNADN